jgi:pyruvate dehydrogenase E1 component alpha subunit
MADEPQLLEIYRTMVTIRRFEEKTAELYLEGKVAGFGNLFPGEEAVAVGAIEALSNQDYIVSTYRQHGHCIARGIEPRFVMAELMGKETGISHGRGGSTHLFDPARRFMGEDGFGAGGLPIAVGLGLSIWYREERDVVACFFGDDALSQGAFHESLNMAALWNLPVIFICENNFYGMGIIAPNAVAQEHLYKVAEPYQIPGVRVDGMDPLEIHGAVKAAVARARAGAGPSLIEAVTYRFRGLSASDPSRYRSTLDERVWQERDPIKNLRRKLLTEGGQHEDRLKQIEAEVEAVIADAIRFAEESPQPRREDVSKHVYAG